MLETTEYARAKINLTLEVVGKRVDGYHELRSIFLPLELHDFIQVRIVEGVRNIRLVSKHDTLNNDKNLIFKAAKLFLNTFNMDYDVEVEFTKDIPSRAGLGGGSSDAAATLRALVKLTNLEVEDNVMQQLALKVGADVPFCYFNQPAYVEGIGEKLQFFEVSSEPIILLVKPKRGLSTKQIFQRLKLKKSSVNYSMQMKSILESGQLKGVEQCMVNDLEMPAFEILPVLQDIKNDFLMHDIKSVMMTGSGSTMFAIIDNLHLAQTMEKHFKSKGMYVHLTRLHKE